MARTRTGLRWPGMRQVADDGRRDCTASCPLLDAPGVGRGGSAAPTLVPFHEEEQRARGWLAEILYHFGHCGRAQRRAGPGPGNAPGLQRILCGSLIFDLRQTDVMLDGAKREALLRALVPAAPARHGVR